MVLPTRDAMLRPFCALVLALLVVAASARSTSTASAVERGPLPASGLELSRPTHAGRFLDVVGRRSAFLGYEHRGLEAWVYPLKIVEDLRLAFRIEGYPLEIPADTIATSIAVRPEATTIEYAHAAFRVRETLFAPIDQPALVLLLDIDSALPLTVIGTFKPRLRLMWPAGLMTPSIDWDAKSASYVLAEESRRFVGVISAPGARDLSIMPYQEEPRDVPLRFEIDVSTRAASELVPIAIAGSVTGRDAALAAAAHLLANVRSEYAAAVDHYRALASRTVEIETPDRHLNEAYAWARVGIDKGLATNPLLGTGLIAGFRTSGDSERPGFAWFFGRDALWTALATLAYGDGDTAKTALEFLRKYQRADGKIPHEISQSASLLPWFSDYPYPWASADATPLYVIAHAELQRTRADRTFLDAAWPSIVKAYQFTRGTDADGNGLVDNTGVGHGWVEGGALYPPHEEIYLQGLWAQAQRDIAELAAGRGDAVLEREGREGSRLTIERMEATYWLDDRGYYAFATKRPRDRPTEAEPGPARATRQARLDRLSRESIVDEDTVLPAVPLWWGLLAADRAERAIDHLGSAAMASDWGQRIIASDSALYDPLSYHYGSVWPLFTGWAATGAYRYGRPHVGYQALMATAHLTWEGALGYITELLSGDFNTPFGRSSHHQIWSEAMLAAPLLRGLLGIEVRRGGSELAWQPQLPASWSQVAIRRVSAAGTLWDLSLTRVRGSTTLQVTRHPTAPPPASALHLVLGPAIPLDARVARVTADGGTHPHETTRLGDIQRVTVAYDASAAGSTAVFTHTPGTDVELDVPAPAPGARSAGLRLLRVRPDGSALRLVVEGLGGREYTFAVRSPTRVGTAEGVTVEPGPDATRVRVRFDGPVEKYVRRELVLPLTR